MESRTQGSRLRSRTALPRTDPLEAKYRNARGQGRRTQAQVFSKKRSWKELNFSVDLLRRKTKKGLRNFSARFLMFSNKILTVPKKCCPRAEDRAIFEDLRLRGQGLDLRDQGKGLQNISSRTTSRPRTSSRTPPLRFTPFSVVILFCATLVFFITQSKIFCLSLFAANVARKQPTWFNTTYSTIW